ncbi:hypothetical protein Q7W24_10680 [Streptococcus suis]|nr:hypothetical protein [Streptococcus suis]
MENWMDYFKPHIVDRGYNLFLDDAVQGLQETGEGYYAVVKSMRWRLTWSMVSWSVCGVSVPMLRK